MLWDRPFDDVRFATKICKYSKIVTFAPRLTKLLVDGNRQHTRFPCIMPNPCRIQFWCAFSQGLEKQNSPPNLFVQIKVFKTVENKPAFAYSWLAHAKRQNHAGSTSAALLWKKARAEVQSSPPFCALG
jgi:hypothetical protein